jgi:hypothetical protein
MSPTTHRQLADELASVDSLSKLFEEIMARCLDAGLVRGDNLSVDGSFIEANANKESSIPREQLAEDRPPKVLRPTALHR